MCVSQEKAKKVELSTFPLAPGFPNPPPPISRQKKWKERTLKIPGGSLPIFLPVFLRVLVHRFGSLHGITSPNLSVQVESVPPFYSTVLR